MSVEATASAVESACGATNPSNGSGCTLPDEHNLANDARVRQHVTDTGYKWPSLHELDPNEGWNGPLPHRL